MKAFNILLNRALSVIPMVPFKFRRFTGITTNEVGSRVQTYGPWISVKRGMIQPGRVGTFMASKEGSRDFKDMGMDWAGDGISVWTSEDIDNIRTGESPDQILWSGKVWNIMDVSNWHGYDGWKKLYCELDFKATEKNAEETA